MRPMTLGGVSALAFALPLSLLLAPPIAAATGDPNRPAVELAYPPTPDEWAPQGTLIADSGFDPTIDSFSFPNYANTVSPQAALLGYPEGQPVVNLTAVEAQRLFGSRAACTYGSGTDCVLNPAVAQWIDAVSAGMAGGHCFGMAAVVAGLFNGVISRAGLTPSSVNATVGFSPAVQRQIAQWFSTQHFFLSDDELVEGAFVPPDEIVNQLVQFLPSGTLPYVLVMWIYQEVDGQEVQAGGHGITPYAVYDRGNGLVDIAVYDNNYPLRARAVHVDLKTNSWEYEVFATPGQQPLVTGGDATNLRLGLVPLAQLTGAYECDFCADAPEGSSVLSGSGLFSDLDSVEVAVTDLDGRPIKGVKERDAFLTSPSGFGFEVPTSGDYRVRVLTPPAAEPGLAAFYEMSSWAQGGAMNVVAVSDGGGVVSMDVGHDTRGVVASANRKAVILQAGMHRDRRLVDYALNVQLNSSWLKKAKTKASPSFILDEDGQTLSVGLDGLAEARIDLALQRVSPATGATSVSTARTGVLMRKGDSVSVDMAAWRHGEVPPVTLTRASGRTVDLPIRVIGPEIYEELVSEEQFAGLLD